MTKFIDIVEGKHEDELRTMMKAIDDTKKTIKRLRDRQTNLKKSMEVSRKNVDKARKSKMDCEDYDCKVDATDRANSHIDDINDARDTIYDIEDRIHDYNDDIKYYKEEIAGIKDDIRDEKTKNKGKGGIFSKFKNFFK
jgi:chromosome segregation ATPase